MGRLWNNDYITLEEEAQGCLGCGFSVFLTDLCKNRTSVFDELVKASSLPCFTTDYGQLQGGYPEGVNIPLRDEDAHITFYIVEK